jgi:hypothetical protein
MMIQSYFGRKFTIIDVKSCGEREFHIQFEEEEEALLALGLDGAKILPKDKFPFRLERV